MKKLFATVISIALCLSFAACGSDSSSSTADTTKAAADTTAAASSTADAPTLAFICKDLSQEWFVGTSSSMLKTAKELGAKDVIMYDCAMSPDKYMTALDNAISQKVDVLIVCPPDQNLSQVTVKRCAEAGIKVMADDDGLIDETGKFLAPALQLDAYKVGEGIGEYLGKYVTDNKIAGDDVGYIVMTMSEVSSCVPRSEGARDAFLKAVPDFNKDKIIEADYDGTTDKGFNVITATIGANPAIKKWLVTAPNDEGAQGATRALEQAGLDKDAIVIGVGGYLAKDEFKKDYSCFKATAYIDPILDGQIAATAAMKWITDGTVAYSEYIGEGEEFGMYPFSATMVDAGTYKDIMGASAE